MDEVENDATLAAVAFGSEPGGWPLPAAATPYQRWLRAVAAGGQGRFASARADLAALLRDRPSGPLASLAYSTQGSFLRQLGWHGLARRWDGRAVALAGSGCRLPGGDPEALADALIGLAADALGTGRFAASAALLARSAQLPEPVTAVPHRSAVRRAWVTAELAMATGDGPTAVRHAERAVELATVLITDTGAGSARHRLKSDVVLAAALCCAGSTDRARAVGDAALDSAGRLGLVPLRWALACLLADVGSAVRTAQQVREIRDGCAALVRCRGGDWRR